nr:glutaredoxin domain-containing protein [uncultured Moraxella sp.]
MIKYIDPNWQDKPSVSIITKPGCPHCAKAKATLKEKGFDFEEIVLGRDASMTSIRAITGRDTAPQVFIGGQHIGGNDDLQAYFAK